MTPQRPPGSPSTDRMPNGSGAAAVLAAGIGSFMIGAFAILADKVEGLRKLMNIYRPTGPLSGVAAAAIVVWLIIWMSLEMRWKDRDVALARINTVAFLLLGLSVLLTFPPVVDLL
jgi:hypothetical protein